MYLSDAKATRWFAGPPYSYWDKIESSGSIWNPHFPAVPDVSSGLIDRALLDAYDQLKSQQIHVCNFLATARDTVRTVENGVAHVARAVRMFRKKTSPKTWELITKLEGKLPRWRWCEIPSAWLELQYGWKPLLADVYGAINHLSRASRYAIPYVEVRGFAKDTDPVESAVDNMFGATNVEATASWKCERKCNVFLVYGIANPVLAELSSLGLVNPLEIVWEVVPYSFVVDWFVPVSGWLSALTADSGFSFITGGYSATTTVVYQGSRISQNNPLFPERQVEVSPPAMRGRFFKFKRSCYANSPVPGIYVKNPLSLTHVANAMSLLVEAFK